MLFVCLAAGDESAACAVNSSFDDGDDGVGESDTVAVGDGRIIGILAVEYESRCCCLSAKTRKSSYPAVRGSKIAETINAMSVNIRHCSTLLRLHKFPILFIIRRIISGLFEVRYTGLSV